MQALATRQCRPRTDPSDRLSNAAINQSLTELAGWTLDEHGPALQRRFKFKDFSQTMLFVNAVAWIAQQQDHHPDLQLGYNHCQVRYSTHSIAGVSENDLICAAMINRVFDNMASTQG